MLKKDEFIEFILMGPKTILKEETTKPSAALPEGFEDYEFDTTKATKETIEPGASFVRRLLEASDFGYPDVVQKEGVIRSSDPVARYLPERVSFWPKVPSRPYQTLLFEADISHRDLLNIPAFRGRKMSHLDIVEDALARMVSEALVGFQKGGEGVTADVRKGRSDETLCIVSIKDERDQEPVRLICFGTQNAKTGGLETFHLTEQTRFWDQPLAREHLGLLYERQFKKLASPNWQEAFTTTEERKQAQKLLDVCSRKNPSEKDIQENIITLLDTIAKSFGLRCKPGQQHRLQAFDLPSDHDIGIDPEERETKHGGRNPFGGVTLRDERNRLLGYIVYPLKAKKDASELRKYLEKNNRFHNVLVVFPEGEETTVELWQGTEQLVGKLRQGHGFEGAAEVVNLLSRFFVVSKAKVRNPTELAQELAFRARYLRRLALKQLEEESEKGMLRELYNTFTKSLIQDQTEDQFADAFAQTITNGMLAARWTGNEKIQKEGLRFTRNLARDLIPTTNPFLRELFTTVLGVKLNEQRGRFLWLVDDIADLLDRVDVVYVFGEGDISGDTTSDPVIHFYEPFLAAYDNDLKRERGVFYTPRPVVSYIVHSVDELLRIEFGLEDGLADTTTWGEIVKRRNDLRIPVGVSETQHFVNILDPATGTGTFLVEVIDCIHQTMIAKWKAQDHCKKNIESLWNEYVLKNLLPRLHGYELLMAPYAIAHLKIGLKLHETGYKFSSDKRARVYLTNALEPAQDFYGHLDFTIPALAHEAQAVNEIKRQQCFTVIIGNPPYSGLSVNMTDYAQQLVNPYKIIDGEALNERKLWLQDDYVKFIRIAQLTIDKSKVGVLAYISNHGYLDNPTFRGMRQSLMGTFTRIRVLDLHGNINKKEYSPDGSEDKNVFDIRQGVCICLAISGIKPPLVEHSDLWGTREKKYVWLSMNTASKTVFATLSPDSPYYFFKPHGTACRDEYNDGWRIPDIFSLNTVGFVTARDSLTIKYSAEEVWETVNRFISLREEEARSEFNLGKDARDWRVTTAQNDVRKSGPTSKLIHKILYRPFDFRYTYYTGNSRGFFASPCSNVMKNMIAGRNLSLCFNRREELAVNYSHFLATRLMTEHGLLSSKTTDSQAPLYIIENKKEEGLFSEDGSSPNLSKQFLAALANKLKLKQSGEFGLPLGITPEDIFFYIYAIFYSPVYRKRYTDLLKVDFPRLPLPSNIDFFRDIAGLGSAVVALHLMESPILDNFITTYIGPKNREVVRVRWLNNTVWLDAPPTKKGHPAKPGTIGFNGVREDIWNFQIGGYQVCEKWLEYRKGRTLSDEDIAHYQRIIVAISETIGLMKQIDEVIDKYGGWPGAFQTKKEGES